MSFIKNFVGRLSPEKSVNLESVPDLTPISDPLALTPKPDPNINPNKRDLEITPPAIENKAARSLTQKADLLKTAFEPPPASKMSENDKIEIVASVKAMFDSLKADMRIRDEKLDAEIVDIKDALGDLHEIKEDIQEGKTDRVRLSGLIVDLQQDFALLKNKPLPPNFENLRKDLKSELKSEIKDELRDDIVKEVSAEFAVTYQTQWVNMLQDEIRRHDSGMIVFGYSWTGGISTDQARIFCKESLKYGENANSLTIKNVSTLSRGRGPQPKLTVLITFGSIPERNEVLSQSFQLPFGVNIDKYMPKRFEEKYKEFKNKAWKLRTSMDVKTWTGFEGPELVIKQKVPVSDSSKSLWVVYDHWSPKASDPSAKKNEPKSDTSRPLPISKHAMQNLVFMSGFTVDRQAGVLETQLKADLIGSEDHNLFSKVVVTKNAAILHFCKVETISAFIQKYAGKEFLGKKIRIS